MADCEMSKAEVGHIFLQFYGHVYLVQGRELNNSKQMKLLLCLLDLFSSFCLQVCVWPFF